MNAMIQKMMATPLVYRERPVVTLFQIDRAHERIAGTAKRTFSEHRARFREGEDFFEVPYAEYSQLPLDLFRDSADEDSSQVDDFKELAGGTLNVQPKSGVGGNRKPIVLITEYGYLLLTKPMRDDLSWEVQRQLINGYFRAQAKPLTQIQIIAAQSQALLVLEQQQLALANATAAATATAEKAQHIAQVAMATTTSNFGYYAVLGYCRLHKKEIDQAQARHHGVALSKLCRSRGVKIRQVRDGHFGAVNTYPLSVLDEHFGWGPTDPG